MNSQLTMNPAMHPFLRALGIIGNSSMAAELGVSPQMISKMAKAAEADPCYQVPANHLRAIERATRGEVSLQQLVLERPAAGRPAAAERLKASA